MSRFCYCCWPSHSSQIDKQQTKVTKLNAIFVVQGQKLRLNALSHFCFQFSATITKWKYLKMIIYSFNYLLVMKIRIKKAIAVLRLQQPHRQCLCSQRAIVKQFAELSMTIGQLLLLHCSRPTRVQKETVKGINSIVNKHIFIEFYMNLLDCIVNCDAWS